MSANIAPFGTIFVSESGKFFKGCNSISLARIGWVVFELRSKITRHTPNVHRFLSPIVNSEWWKHEFLKIPPFPVSFFLNCWKFDEESGGVNFMKLGRVGPQLSPKTCAACPPHLLVVSGGLWDGVTISGNNGAISINFFLNLWKFHEESSGVTFMKLRRVCPELWPKTGFSGFFFDCVKI